MQPSDHTSTSGPYTSAPSSSSGGRYHSVMTWFVYARSSSESNRRASPKSAIFTSPRLLSSRLDPARARWHTYPADGITFDVAVQEVARMAEANALQQLLHHVGDLVVVELDQIAVNQALEIVLHVLKHLPHA